VRLLLANGAAGAALRVPHAMMAVNAASTK
jgi:hypothetical protein